MTCDTLADSNAPLKCDRHEHLKHVIEYLCDIKYILNHCERLIHVLYHMQSHLKVIQRSANVFHHTTYVLTYISDSWRLRNARISPH